MIDLVCHTNKVRFRSTKYISKMGLSKSSDI